MGQLIQICGLPRSGTGFASVLLALHPHCVSYHELIAKNDDAKSKIEDSLGKYNFVVDCNTYGYYPKHTYDASKKVFIQRNLFDSLESSNRIFGKNIPIKIYLDAVDAIRDWRNKWDVLYIDFNDLFSVSGARAIWMHVFGSAEWFNEEKVTQLINMNIQMQSPRVIVDNTEVVGRIKEQLKL